MWLTILGMSAVTYALRATMLVTRRRFPDWLGQALAYVPIALFAALAAPGLLRPHGSVALGPEAVAGGVAALVAWRTAGRMPLVIGAGLGTFLLVRLLLG
ncbi:MAG: AzlD domain-containing protein [Thermomicrobiales bacterium]